MPVVTIFVAAMASVLPNIAAEAETPAAKPGVLAKKIDQLIVAGHENYAEQATRLTTDEEFLRRVTLDLNGTIPSMADVRAFINDSDPNKRQRKVDELLASPAYARRMSQIFDVVFMERRADSKVPRADWETYLRSSFAQNKPYDKLVEEILSADGTDPKNRGPAKFYLDRDFDPDLVTRDIGRIFFGRNIQCAQCHDHPLVDDYKQAEYFGIYAFLNRSFLFPNDKDAKAVLAEKAEGEVNFTSVFDPKKKQHTLKPQIPGGKPVDEPSFEKGKEYKVKPEKNVRPVPNYSRRSQLGGQVASADNPYFARTAANRVWAMMLGRGLVHPVDMDHSDNPPSHPELLESLAKELAEHNFDLKWLIREIALSDTYQRSSVVETEVDLPEDRFLVGSVKPLSPEQLAYAVLEATGRVDIERAALKDKATDEAVDGKLASRVVNFRRIFAASPGEPEEEFVARLDQTLFLKHDGALRQLIEPAGDNLTARLLKIDKGDAFAEELFLSVLCRKPTAEETQDVAEWLEAGGDKPTIVKEIIWALLASAEFRFNH